MLEERVRVSRVGEAIADGLPIAWDAIEAAAAEGAERALLRDLRVVAEIVAVHQRLTPITAASTSVVDELRDSREPGVRSDDEPSDATVEALPAWGHLRLLERVGASASSEVYRARDARLERDVALKVLRRHDSARPRGSFIIDEGRLLARVRHPNVVTVFGADRIEGHVGVWMEFIRGQTLEEELRARGPFGAAEVTHIGIELCRALAAVHDAGLLHRAVKARNVMRDADGRIVLMDFGTDLEESVRERAGVPPWVAPEIPQGGPASAQSDLYSLGVLLYQLATGHYALAGEMLCDLPAPLGQVIGRALAPDPQQRYPSATELEAALAALTPTAAERTVTRWPGWRRAVWRAALVVVLSVAVGIGLWRQLHVERQTQAGSLRAPADRSTLVVRRIGSFGDEAMLPVPSPDGRSFAYTERSAGNLVLLDVATQKKRQLTHNESWDKPGGYALWYAVSADGQHVAYSWDAGTLVDLRVVGVDGGEPRVLYRDESVAAIEPAEWSRDGAFVLASVHRKDETREIVLVSVADGAVRVLRTSRRSSNRLSLSPDGRYVAYDAAPKDGVDAHDIYVLAVDGSRDMPLVQGPAGDAYPIWAPDGTRVIFVSDRGGALGAWAIQVAEGRPRGSPEVINRDMGRMVPVGLTQQGTYYYSVQTGMVDVYVASLDPITGRVIGSAAPVSQGFVGSNISPEWSPDGRWLAYVSQRRGRQVMATGSRVLTIRAADGAEQRDLSPLLGFFIAPRWASDGRSVFVKGSDRQGWGLHEIDAGTGRVLSTRLRGKTFADVAWSRDGKAMVYSLDGSIWTEEVRTGRTRELYRGGTLGKPFWLRFSPDDRWLAFAAFGQDKQSIAVIPITGGAARELVTGSSGQGGAVVLESWTRDGRYLLFTRTPSNTDGTAKGELWRVAVQGGTPEPLGLGMVGLREVRLHPDGRRIAFTAGWPIRETWAMENFLPPSDKR